MKLTNPRKFRKALVYLVGYLSQSKGSLVEWAKMLGRTFKVCSKNCLDEIDMKVCKSILGEEDKDVKGSSISG